MNAPLFHPHVADHNRLVTAKREGRQIGWCDRTKLLTIDGELLGYPANLGTRAKAEAYAELHNFTLTKSK